MQFFDNSAGYFRLFSLGDLTKSLDFAEIYSMMNCLQNLLNRFKVFERILILPISLLKRNICEILRAVHQKIVFASAGVDLSLKISVFLAVCLYLPLKATLWQN